MSSSFNCQEQRYSDLWSAIARLKEGVVTIRERGRREIDLLLTMQEEEVLLSEINKLKQQAKRNIINALSVRKNIKSISKAISENRSQQGYLQKEIEKLSDKVNEYITYSDSFKTLTFEDFCYLLNNRARDYDTLAAIVLLSLNNGMMPEEREKVINKLKEVYEFYIMFYQEDVREAYIGFVGAHFH